MKTLFLKYRPQDFKSIVGQEHVVRTLQNSVKQDRVSHAYVFSGSRGTGKTSTARILAKALNAGMKDGDIDLSSSLAEDIASGHCVDVIEIDAASNRGIDEIRDLREKVLYAPSVAEKKVYIIDEVHMLTKEAFNALLKTIEEPPEHAYFVLATTELHKIPETILSRCQVFYFQRIQEADIVGRLRYIAGEEQIDITDGALGLVAKKAEGGLRDSISYLEQLSAEYEGKIDENEVREGLGMVSNEIMGQLWGFIGERNISGALGLVKTYGSQGGDFRSFGHDFLRFLQDKLHDAVAAQESTALIVRCIDRFHEALVRIKTSPLPSLPFEVAIVGIYEQGMVVAPPVHNGMSPASVVSPMASKAPQAKPVVEASTPVVAATKPAIAEKKAPSVSPQSKDEGISGFIFGEDPIAPVENVKKAPVVERPKVVEVSEASGGGGGFMATQTKVASSLKEIADGADIPSYAKRSLMTTKIRLVGSQIVFVVDSDFHYGKLNKPEVVTALTDSCERIFGQRPVVSFEVKKVASGGANLDDFDF